MIFTDVMFVFCFLPISVILAFTCGEDWSKNAFSLVFSLLFIVWGRPWQYLLILASVALIYVFGRVLERSGKIFELLGDAVAAATSFLAIYFLPDRGSLTHALLSVGFVGFSLRAMHYLKEVSEFEPAERSFARLAVYLISFENMLIPQLRPYKDVRGEIASRRPVLKRSSEGVALFVKGFALGAVCALSCDSVRLASTEYSAYPWANPLVSFIVTALGAYVCVSAFVSMSRGISLVYGYRAAADYPYFGFKATLGEHADCLMPGFSDFIADIFSARSFGGFITLLAPLCVITGGLIGLGLGAAGAFCLIIIGIALERCAPEGLPKAVKTVFAATVCILAFLLLAFRSPKGIARAFGSLTSPSAYDYDITYILNYELLRRLPWLIIGAALVSPPAKMIAERVRERADGSESFYFAYKLCETAACCALLVLAAAAALR